SLVECLDEIKTDLKDMVDETELRLQRLEDWAVRAEDRQRKRNFKVVGFSEEIQGKDIIPELLSILSANDIGTITEEEIERAHRELKPRTKENACPSDVIVALCKEKLMEQLLKDMRKKGPLNHKGATLRFVPDFSWETTKKRQEMRTFTKEWSKANCRFSWIYPATISLQEQ
ncbi:hypothetical protein JRQ81_019005, partial [Phrynocephalus forsythii]